MSDIRQARTALIAQILEGDGAASHAQRRAAFASVATAEPQSTLIDKLTKHPNDISDADVAATLASGLSEDQVFELTVCAAVGQATRQYETALAALDAATETA
jgi:alkylhydroperoxidase family enzyme